MMASTDGRGGGPASLDRRDADALTRCMTVVDDVGWARDAPGLFLVVSDSGREYRVDFHEGTCECADHFFRGARCVHLRRVAFATGERAIPAWTDRDRVDGQLGQHFDGSPRFEGGRSHD